MTGVHQSHDSSSGDTVVLQTPTEKSSVETPSPAAQEKELENHPDLDTSIPAEDPEKDEENDTMKKQPSGAPLDRTPPKQQRWARKRSSSL